MSANGNPGMPKCLFTNHSEQYVSNRLTCEGKDGAVRSASGQEVGHVASSGVDKDG